MIPTIAASATSVAINDLVIPNNQSAIITVFTLGICYPWALCMLMNWKVKHTIIEGRRLKFDGTAVGLFGLWIKWLLLGIITFGIYFFGVGISLEKWKVKHTQFM